MKYKELGQTGIYVSQLCLGAMTFGGAEGVFGQIIGGLGQPEVDRLVGQSLDAGINFFDTANVYSVGQSETLLGKALGAKRNDVILATKVFGRMGAGPNQVGASRVQILQQVEASLKRLGTDYIDLYQIHGFDSVTPLEETLRTFDDLVRQGKVRYLGCSNFSAWQIMKAIGISQLQNLEKFASLQAYYSLAGRDLEHEIVPFLQDQKLGLMTWSPLAGGLLSGKFTRGGKNDMQSRRMKFDFPPVDVEKALDIVEVLQKIAARHSGATVAQVALGWQLHQEHVTCVILGAKNEAQLADNLKSVSLSLTGDDLAEIDAVSKPSPIYPGWMQQFQSDRKPGSTREMNTVLRPTIQ
jgi:aryl-alcohol dehydrogenase-like predicted oxidoreductase